MKTSYFIIPSHIISLLVLSSCNNQENIEVAIRNSLSAGAWKIGYFTDDGENKTDLFADYTFRFSYDGAIHIMNGPINLFGSYHIPSSPDKLKELSEVILTISQLEEGGFIDLNGPWTFISQSAELIELESTRSTGTDYLTFKR